MGHRILRKGFPDPLLIDLLVDINNLLELGRSKVGVFLRLVLPLDPYQLHLEIVMRQSRRWTHHDIAEHIDEPAVAVPPRAFVPGFFDKSHHGPVRQAKVQHGVHHPGHRNRRAGTNRNQKGITRITEVLSHGPFKFFKLLLYLIHHARRISMPVFRIVGARLRRDGKPRGYRQVCIRHLGKVGPLTTENRLHRRVALGVLFAEPVKENVLLGSFCILLGHV